VNSVCSKERNTSKVHHSLSCLFSGARRSSGAAAFKAREMSVKIQRVRPDGACCARGPARSAKHMPAFKRTSPCRRACVEAGKGSRIAESGDSEL